MGVLAYFLMRRLNLIEGETMKNALFVYGSGSVGALLACITFWLIQVLGLAYIIHMPNFPILSEAWLYPKIIWGGGLALCFALPFMRTNTLIKGVIFALIISLIELFLSLPFSPYKGAVGLNIGMYTFAFIMMFNLVWALMTGLMLKIAK